MYPPASIAATAFVADNVQIAAGVVIGPGAAVYGPTRLEAGARIDANATVAAPLVPPAAPTGPTAACVVGQDAVIGAGAVIHPGVQIQANAVIAPATLVVRNVPPFAMVSGNPATITGYLNTPGLPAAMTSGAQMAGESGAFDVGVGGATLYRLPHIRDLRGDLSVGEFDSALPFVPLRYFLVFDVPSESTRGEHAHKACHQFLVCTSGRCALIVDDGENRMEILLDRPTVGLHIPPGIWGIQYKYSRDAVLLVFASHHYDANDYIRDYHEFLRYKA